MPRIGTPINTVDELIVGSFIRIDHENGVSSYATVISKDNESATLRYFEIDDFETEWDYESLGLVVRKDGWRNPNRVVHTTPEAARSTRHWDKVRQGVHELQLKDAQAAAAGQPTSGWPWSSLRVIMG